MKTLNDYHNLTRQAVALIDNEDDLMANLANISALLNMNLTDINWVGFYFLKNNMLVLGPFQGKVACTRIPLNKGVCGKAASNNCIQRVTDVHDFPGHIACDADSQSEIVIPMNVNDKMLAVLDIDSPSKGRFSELDEQGLAYFVEQVTLHLG